VKRGLPSDCLQTLYYALAHSHFTYSIIAWGNSNLKSLFTLQKRAIRLIHNTPYNGHTDPRLKSSGILKIIDLFIYQSLIFMYDYLSSRLPSSFNGIFNSNCDRPNGRATRQSTLFYTPRCYSAFARKLPLYFLPHAWKSIIKSDTLTRGYFKRQIKNYILNKYQSYVQCDYDRCLKCHRH